MIPPALEQFVCSVVAEIDVFPRVEEEIKLELLSHVHQEYFELQLQGRSETEAVRAIIERFGDPKNVANEFAVVHDAWSRRQWAVAVGLLWYIANVAFVVIGGFFGEAVGSGDVFGTFMVALFGGVNPFMILISVLTFFDFSGTGAFIYAFMVVAMALVSLNAGLAAIFKLPVRERVNFVNGAAIIGLLVFVAVFLLSYRELPVAPPDILSQPAGVAGFPWKAIYFPVGGAGADNVPLPMWPPFFLNYGVIWFGCSIIAFLVRRRWALSERRLRIVLMGTIFLLLQMLIWIVIRFD